MRKRFVLGSVLAVVIVMAGLAAIGLFAANNDSGTTSMAIAPAIAQQGGPAKGLPSAADLFASGGESAAASAATAQAAQPAPNAYSSTAGAGGTGSSLPSLLDRKVILNASLALTVSDVSAAFSEASRLTRTSGGYVEQSSYSGADLASGAKPRAASLTLRVPADQYDALLAGLRGIQGAKVTGEGSKSSEVTEQYTDLQSRLRNLEATEQSYLKLLDQAKSIPDILTVNDRLDGIRAQIEQIQGRLNVLDKMTDLATIDLTLVPAVPGKAEPKGDGPKPISQAFADAWEGSLDVLRYAAAGGAVVLVAIGWLIIPAMVVVVAIRRMSHRRPQPAPERSAAVP